MDSCSARQIAGTRGPAIVYVHGGGPRQMLLGYHYRWEYANDYAINQYFASRGFIVLSVNYRLSVGYGEEYEFPEKAARAARRSIATCRPRGCSFNADPTSIHAPSGSGARPTAAISRRSGSAAIRKCSRPASISTASTIGCRL